jgi:hypothetical protein
MAPSNNSQEPPSDVASPHSREALLARRGLAHDR